MFRISGLSVAAFTLTILPCAAKADATTPVALSVPGFYGPLAANQHPFHFNAGPAGKIYITGIASGLALTQNNVVSTADSNRYDVSNGQVSIQNIDGPVQFYIQAGAYTLPSLGTPYVHAQKTTQNTFGYLPIAYLKIAPTDHFSIQIGKLYTLIGTENTFTFQNANVERGLLWNQTNAVNRGVQVNYSQGAFSGSLSLSDGFYSDKYTWLSGLGTLTIDPQNSVTVIASGNLDSDNKSTFATPLAQNNSQIYDLSYNYTTGPWTLTPTLQYTHVMNDAGVGLIDSASTYGAGLTAKYNIDERWNLAGRVEYIDSTGGTNVAYGPGSNAWSFTLTPTYQYKQLFARPEASYVRANDTTAGSAFGTAGDERSQGRLLIEAGILF